MNILRQSRWWKQPVMLFLILLAASYLLPVAYMALRSVQSHDPNTVGKTGFTTAHFSLIFENAGFLRYIWNSTFVLIFVLAANVGTAIMVGYAFSRYSFPWRNKLFYLVLLTLMIPKQVLVVPILNLMVFLGLQNTLWALILPFCVDSFNIFLIRQYLENLPRDLEDAARVDGASELSILWNVIIPLCRPALALIIINTAIVTWNSFLFPLILTDSAEMRTLPVGLAMLTQGPHSTDWGVLMAGAMTTSLPMIILFVIFQKQIVEGITSGALRE